MNPLASVSYWYLNTSFHTLLHLATSQRIWSHIIISSLSSGGQLGPASSPKFHELDAGIEGVVKPEEQKEVLFHWQKLGKLGDILIFLSNFLFGGISFSFGASQDEIDCYLPHVSRSSHHCCRHMPDDKDHIYYVVVLWACRLNNVFSLCWKMLNPPIRLVTSKKHCLSSRSASTDTSST